MLCAFPMYSEREPFFVWLLRCQVTASFFKYRNKIDFTGLIQEWYVLCTVTFATFAEVKTEPNRRWTVTTQSSELLFTLHSWTSPLRKIPLCGHYKQKIHKAKIYPPWMTIWSSWQTSWSTKNSLMLVRWSPDSWRISPSSGSTRTLPLHLKVFFKAFAILAISKSSARPWTVVMHLRPFRCWTRMWILELSLPALLVKGSERINKC